MRYILGTYNGKLDMPYLSQKEGKGKKVYIVHDENDTGRVVEKGWVIKNIEQISNAEIVGTGICIVEDKYDKAVIMIKDEIEQSMGNWMGLDFEEHYAHITKHFNNIPLNEVSPKQQHLLWIYAVERLGISMESLYIKCISEKMDELESRGTPVWSARHMLNGVETLYLFTMQEVAQEYMDTKEGTSFVEKANINEIMQCACNCDAKINW